MKGAGEGLGAVSLAKDLDIEVGLDVKADSSAAIGICRRSGIGKIRHLATGQLWVQERLREGDFRLFKYPGQQNPADIFTKPLPKDVIERHGDTLGLEPEAGRAVSAPSIEEQLPIGEGGGAEEEEHATDNFDDFADQAILLQTGLPDKASIMVHDCLGQSIAE